MAKQAVETVVPEGRGKAMALQSFLAQGGGRSSYGGKKNAQFLFQSGPMKGMTEDQAVSLFETKWAGASGTIKDKYARMGGNEGTLSPSETDEYNETKAASAAVNDAAGIVNKPDTISGDEPATADTKPAVAGSVKELNPNVAAAPMGAQARRIKMYADQKAARMAYYAPAPQIQKKSAASKQESTAGELIPGSDAARAAAAKEMEAGDKYRTADTGDGGMAAAVAMRDKAATTSEPAPGQPGSIQQGPPAPEGYVSPKASPATPAATPNRTVSDKQPSELSRMAGKVFNGIRGVFGMEQKPEAPARVPDGKELGSPVQINRLTGLPFGYRPGDALPTGADGTMKQMAGESVARQTEASASAAKGKPLAPVGGMASPAQGFTGISMPRGPASQPQAIISREARPAPRADDPNILKKDDAAYAAYQAGIGGASDKDFQGLKGAQKKIYDGASSMDQARLIGNTLKRSGEQMEAEGMGKPYAPPGANTDQKKRTPIGRR